MGLDLSNGTVRKNLEAGVIEPAMSKVKIIQVKDKEHMTGVIYLFLFMLSNFANSLLMQFPKILSFVSLQLKQP